MDNKNHTDFATFMRRFLVLYLSSVKQRSVIQICADSQYYSRDPKQCGLGIEAGSQPVRG